ncbi:MAG: 4-hydroxy-tetrahydrodipicolinate reductase [Candidatus Azotimanducaceae bacterium]|jgi:4-hydroxy-tetrahydrodipicolinate reductase
MTRIAVVGAAGRMGKILIAAAANNAKASLTAAIVRPNSAAANGLAVDAGELAGIGRLEVAVTDSLEAVVDDFDILIDFTTPAATLENLEVCARFDKKMVIGTTGFSPGQFKQLQAFGELHALVFAPNFSVGVNAAFHLIGIAAEILGGDTDIDITEAHHKHKVDAPSGTALRMGEIIQDKIVSEDGDSDINYNSIRVGDIVGEHTVMFAGAGERIEITHRAMSRMNFATGAVRAALWLNTKPTGMFDMQDVLGLGRG